MWLCFSLCTDQWDAWGSSVSGCGDQDGLFLYLLSSPGTRVPPEVCSSHENDRNFREQVETQEDIKFLAQKLHTSTYMPLVKMGYKPTPSQAMEKSTLSSFSPHKGMDAKRGLELGSISQYMKQYSSFLCLQLISLTC